MGVVFIHIKFPGLFGLFVQSASKYAVPIFFMIAGYFAFGKDPSVIKRRLLKIVKIFAAAYSLFFLYYITEAIARHNAETWLLNHFGWKTPIKYLVFCAVDFAIPLWYLIALTEVYVLWLIIVNKGKEDAAVKTTPILFVLQILLTTYCKTMKLAWFWKVNFVTSGLPWFLLGYYLNTPKAEKIRETSTSKLILLAVVGCVISVIPSVFRLPIKFDAIGEIPYAFGLFVLTLKNPDKSTCRLMEFVGEKLSLYIYVFHVLVNGALIHVLTKLKIDTKNVVFLWCKPILALIATIFVSLFILALKTRKRRA